MAAQTMSEARVSGGSRLSFQSDPAVDSTANVHEFSLVEGDVQVGAGAMIAPGTAVTAESGASVVIGEDAQLLPGVIAEAVAGPQVTGEDGSPASIWVGQGSAIAHKSLIHSPAYIGKNCFIGFRSTVYNARLGDGCVVMMHVLVQDVEVPPGKCIPSGSVITSQHQADQLPNVRPEDIEFAREVTGRISGQVSGQVSGGRDRRASSSNRSSSNSRSRIVPIRPAANRKPSYSTATEGANMQTQRLSSDVVEQVRQHLNQGYRIGMEHADKRRYRSGVWETCTPIKETNEQAVFAGLERCISEHEGEYVRMFGIDPQAKSRVGTMTIQRPGDKPNQNSNGSSNRGSSNRSSSQNNRQNNRQNDRQSGGYQSSNTYSSSQNGGGPITPAIAQEVRNLMSSGYIIGTEHAGPRHYRSNVWKVCSPIESRNEREVFARLEHCLDEHSGEYVRMFGIDPKANRRTASTTIQRADGKPIKVSTHNVPDARGYDQSSARYSPVDSDASDKVEQAVGQIIRNGNKIGVEYADKRRYRSGIWQTAPTLKANNRAAASNQLQKFLNEHPDQYVRIFGVDTEMKTRGSSITIQKPGQRNQSSSDGSGNSSGRYQDPINENPPHYDDPSFRNRSGGRSGSNGNGLSADVRDQVTRLVKQGHKISIEYADKRRYRSGIWKTGSAIKAHRPAEAISALGKQLAQHQGEYVRLVGTDSKVKRRVVETTIQRPGQSGSQNRSSGGFSRGQDPINENPPHYDDPSFRGQPSSYDSSGYSAGNAGSNMGANNGSLESEVMNQVTQLVKQGHKISLEYADKRRYRSGIWKTGEAIDARRPAEAISALGKQLAQHRGEYVRLIGTDPQAKRRVLETTIQRP